MKYSGKCPGKCKQFVTNLKCGGFAIDGFTIIWYFLIKNSFYDRKIWIAGKGRNIWSHIISLLFIGVLAIIIAIYKIHKLKMRKTNV